MYSLSSAIRITLVDSALHKAAMLTFKGPFVQCNGLPVVPEGPSIRVFEFKFKLVNSCIHTQFHFSYFPKRCYKWLLKRIRLCIKLSY